MALVTYKNLDPRIVRDQNKPKPSTDFRQHKFGAMDTAKDSPPFLTEVELIKVFKRFDGNRDGRLSRQELKNAFESLGSYFPTYRAIMALFRADKNRDGYITLDEMRYLIEYALSCNYYDK
ncbi:Calcium-binding EF-hand [Corchorus olitorius]|uniref:Calcium-binding EF-hand n=1 Tax=Corchorus olitorius TaxID=93759 RepID=A0A1R3JDU8_9ROSI|nr:Calcium-binding EF-hand [Corchorus olitorius]